MLFKKEHCKPSTDRAQRGVRQQEEVRTHIRPELRGKSWGIECPSLKALGKNELLCK